MWPHPACQSCILILHNAAEDTKDIKEPEEQHEDKKAKTEAGSKATEAEEQHEDKKANTEAPPAADPTEPLAEGKPKNVVEEGRIYFFYRYPCRTLALCRSTHAMWLFCLPAQHLITDATP